MKDIIIAILVFFVACLGKNHYDNLESNKLEKIAIMCGALNMKKGTRVQNVVSGTYATISGEADYRETNSINGKWAYGVRKDNGQYTAWACQNVVAV